MPAALAKEGAFGFGLQTEKGTFVSPTTWLPLIEGGTTAADTVSKRLNYQIVNMADQRDYQTSYYSAGEWAEGRVRVPLMPGSLTELLTWIQTRDGDNQGKWASVLIDCVNTVKKLTDSKVGQATFEFVKGQPVVCTLDVVALDQETGTTPSPTMPVGPPYVYREAEVQLETGGSGLSAEVNCERLQIVVDNVLEDPEEGLRLEPGPGPTELYNLSGIRCSGYFDRDFVDSAVYDDFVSGTEAALTLTLTRGVNVATFTLPRLLYTQGDVHLPGRNDARITQRVEFVALGSEDGLTPPITLA